MILPLFGFNGLLRLLYISSNFLTLILTLVEVSLLGMVIGLNGFTVYDSL